MNIAISKSVIWLLEPVYYHRLSRIITSIALLLMPSTHCIQEAKEKTVLRGHVMIFDF